MNSNKPNERHSFDVPIAMVMGVEKAVIFKEIAGWCLINEKKEHNIHVELAWTYNPAKAYAKHFPYLSKHPKAAQKKADRLIRELEIDGYLFGHKFNSYRGDHTKSHTVNWDLYTYVLETGEYSPDIASDFIEFLCSNLSNRMLTNGDSGLRKNEESRLRKNEHSYTTSTTPPSTPSKGKSKDSPEDVFIKIEGLREKIGAKHYEILNAACLDKDSSNYQLANGMYKDGRFGLMMDWLEYKKQSRKGLKAKGSITSLINLFADHTPKEMEKAVQTAIANGYTGLFPKKLSDKQVSQGGKVTNLYEMGRRKANVV